MHFQTRWSRLFADLEAEAAAAEADERAWEVADRTRGEVARIELINRLRAGAGRRIELRVAGSTPLVGAIVSVGADWVLVEGQAELVVMLDAIQALVGLSPQAVSETGLDPVGSRVGWGTMLRAISRDRSPVQVTMRDGATVFGTPDRVGANFVELAQHAVGEVPRAASVAARWTIAVDAVSMVARARSE